MSPYPIVWKFHISYLKKGEQGTMCIHLIIYEIIYESLSVFPLEHFNVLLMMFYCCQPCLIWSFVKIFQARASHILMIKQNTRQAIDSNFSLRIRDPRKLFKPKKTKGLHSFWEVKSFG